MKTHPLSTAARMIGIASLLVLILTLAYNTIQADPADPGPEWVNFYSANTTFLSQPVQVDAVIAAFDPQGVQCGQYTVTVKGKYGYLPCYRDDETTPEDDGADPGDVISFTINGLPATPVPISFNGTPISPSTTITWTHHGDRWEVDLRVPPMPTPIPVGGVIVPVNGLELVASWLRLMAVVFLAALAVVLVRRRKT